MELIPDVESKDWRQEQWYLEASSTSKRIADDGCTVLAYLLTTMSKDPGLALSTAIAQVSLNNHRNFPNLPVQCWKEILESVGSITKRWRNAVDESPDPLTRYLRDLNIRG